MAEEKTLRSIIITDNNVQILDQLLLPHETKLIDIKNTKDAWSAINKMQVRGAPMISVVALYGLKMEIFNSKEEILNFTNEQFLNFIKEKSNYLRTSRPTAVNLSNDLEGLNKHLLKLKTDKEELNPESELQLNVQFLISETFKFIENNYKEYEESSKKISTHGADIILNLHSLLHKSAINILTICNTGKLAMPGDGTALGIIREIARRKKLNKLFIPETRPYNQGSRLTAFEALYDNLPGILISDSMAGILFQNKEIDCVIVGADRITKSGATANKIGTFTFSVLAHHHNIPFYVAAPESSIDFSLISGKDIHIEERPADELRKISNFYLSPKDIKVFNPSFDVTPSYFIDGIITEKGNFNFDKSLGFWKQLNISQLEDLLKYKIKIFKPEEILEFSDIADGNLNNVYRVKGEKKAYCIKQALPYVKCVGPEWELSLKRIGFETESLKYAQKIVPELVPKFEYFDEDYCLLIMEFLENHVILRKELIQNQIIDNLGDTLGKYISQTCFYSSNLHLSPKDLRKEMNLWNENTLCELTEQVIFSDPYINSKFNKWTSPHLDNIVEEFKSNQNILISMTKLREKFICKKQALIHGDLHTGSIMVNKENSSIKVIDPEFSFYGPIAFDIGLLIANFFMNYFSKNSQKAHLKEDDLTNIQIYETYILAQIERIWYSFKDNFTQLWSDEKIRYNDFPGLFENKKNHELLQHLQNEYFQDLFEEVVGFTGCEIIRRIIGIAHNPDFETIENIDLKAACEKKALIFSQQLLINYKNINNINDLIKLASDINASI